MGMWLQFRGVGYQRGVYLSNGGHSANNHGVALLYSKGRLDVIFKMADGREWRTRAQDVLEERWYHVAATWSQDKGLHLYINGEKKGQDKSVTKKPAANENSRYNGFYIGRANDNTGTDRLGQVLVDDFKFESTFKEDKEVRESGKRFWSRPFFLFFFFFAITLHDDFGLFSQTSIRLPFSAFSISAESERVSK